MNGYLELLVMLCVFLIVVVDSDDCKRDRHLTILSLDGVHVA